MATVTTVPPIQWNIDGMMFDAWLSLHHSNSLTITEHPVESGAAIADHSYINPKRFSFQVGYTDVVSSPAVQGAYTRSINAYIKLVELMNTRKLLTLTSKYGITKNILIENIDVPDDFSTKNAMKATVNLREIIIAELQFSKVSNNPQLTDTTNRGRINAQSATPKIVSSITSFFNNLFR